jgi:hypothetical protein
MNKLTWPELRRMRKQIDALVDLAQRKHLGKAQHDELVGMIASHKRGREYLVSTERELDDAELEAIRASKRAPTEEKRRTYLEKVSRIRREKRKLHGEV